MRFDFSIFPKNDSDIEGIIRHFPSMNIQVYSSSVNGDNSTYGPQNVLDHSTTNYWRSSNTANQQIFINFTDFAFYATNYSFQTFDCIPSGCDHPKQWKAEGFQNNNWIEIDNVVSSRINGRYLIETRPISVHGPFSSFRFTSTGLNWASENFFRIMNIDFFGYTDSINITSFPQPLSLFLCYPIRESFFTLLTIFILYNSDIFNN